MMPKDDTRAERLFRLARYLETMHRPFRTHMIACLFEVSDDTALRDLSTLSRLGVPLVKEGQHWKLEKVYARTW